MNSEIAPEISGQPPGTLPMSGREPKLILVIFRREGLVRVKDGRVLGGVVAGYGSVSGVSRVRNGLRLH